MANIGKQILPGTGRGTAAGGGGGPRIETTTFDSADYLNTAEAIAAYLDAYLEDATPEELRNALATVARSHGISDLARRSGVSRPGIYKALGQDGNPSFETIRSILSAMGLRLTVEPSDREPA
ncbi:MAG TPA: addiction module antidote protein [Sphingomicrobium sp.]|jgi:probable addiction module antidote protein|nr:addiction module antidote protein [Sphingomicrobium sp.]